MHVSRFLLYTSVSLPALLIASSSHALPQGGQVAAGNATITSSGTATTIAQGSDRAVIDWNAFDIGAGEAVTFRQPSATSVALNRISGQRPSEIFGRLSANGQVILSNPNGFLFAKGSSVDVAGLIATTAGIGTDAFMRDAAWAFSSPGKPDASIINEGTITAHNAGLVALVAPLVVNEGFIGARLGRIQLAAADTFTLDLYGDGLLSLAAGHVARIDNPGTLLARGGQVLLTAAQGAALLDSVINTTGVIDVSASRIDPSGIIVFGNGIGGDIALSARTIDVGSCSVLNASGPAGGGTIHIGGGRQGALLSLSGQALPNAGKTTIAADSRLTANATAKGGGGTVIAWADGTTRFDGHIEAKGGPAGGDGGFVETSGRQFLGVTGTVDASAPKGKAGDWLLDPRNVTISGAGVYSVNPAGEAVDPSSDNFTILDSSISTALSNGNNVTITTGTSGAQAGDITLSGATISKTGGGDATLTLKADNSILTSGLNTVSSSAGKLHTIFWADANVHSVAAGGVVQLNDTTISTNGGDLILAGGLDNGANGGTAADGRPDNYAWGNAGYPMGLTMSAVHLDSGTGNIRLLGHGWDNAGSNAHIGISLDWGSTITAHGAGAITAIGVGGTGIDYNYGLNMDGSSGANVITAEAGPTTLIGAANGTGQFNHGLILYNGNTVASIGGGVIQVTGTAAATVNSADIVTAAGTNVIGNAGSGGDVTLSANNLDMQQCSVSTPGSIAFKPRSPGTTIGISGGTCGGACSLQLTDALLARLHPDSDGNGAGSLIIGDSVAGTGTVTVDGWDLSGQTFDVEVHGGTVDLTGGSLTWNGGNDITLSSRTGDFVIDQDFIRNAGTAGDGTLTLKAAGSISSSGPHSIAAATAGATGKLHTVLWSDADNSGAGSISLGNAAITTNGGDLVIAGGLDNGANGGLAGDGRPDNDSVGTAANHAGISLANAAINTGAGNVTLYGSAWNAAMALLHGVQVSSGTTVTSTAGDITIRGRGGNGTAQNYGVYIKDNGTSISTSDGNLRIIGIGGNGSSNNNAGITIEGSSIASVGTGASAGIVTLDGTGGSGNAINFGISIDSALLSTVDGDLAINGVGGNGTPNGINAGIIISGWGSDNTISSSGTGAITLTASHLSSSDPDLYLESAGAANIIGGPITTSDITIFADSITSFANNHYFQTSGDIIVKPMTLGRPINVAGGSGGLDLPVTVLDNLAAGEIVLGQAAGTGIVTLGAYAWDDPVRFMTGPAGSIAVSGAQTAAAGSNATLTFAGPTTLNANLDLTNATGGTQAILFNDAVTLGGNRTLALGAGDLSFNGALDGAFDLAVVTTGDVAFAANAGALTPLADVTLTGAHDVTGDSLFADSFTLTGTGDVVFSTNSLHTAGDITIDTAGNITGGYHGQDGHLYSSGGALSALVDFDTLDISGLSATLLPGRVGAAGAADQTMANRISIDGLRDPWGPLIPNPAYRFNSYLIGSRGLAGSGPRGGQGGAGQTLVPPPPQEPRPPISGPPVPGRGFAVDFGNVPFPVAFAGIRANQVMVSGEFLLEDPYPAPTELFTDTRDQVGSSSSGEHSGTEQQGW